MLTKFNKMLSITVVLKTKLYLLILKSKSIFNNTEDLL